MNYHLPPLNEEELKKMVDAWNEYFGVIRKMVKNDGGSEEQASDVFSETYATLRAAELAGEFKERNEAFSARLYQLAASIWQKNNEQDCEKKQKLGPS